MRVGASLSDPLVFVGAISDTTAGTPSSIPSAKIVSLPTSANLTVRSPHALTAWLSRNAREVIPTLAESTLSCNACICAKESANPLVSPVRGVAETAVMIPSGSWVELVPGALEDRRVEHPRQPLAHIGAEELFDIR